MWWHCPFKNTDNQSVVAFAWNRGTDLGEEQRVPLRGERQPKEGAWEPSLMREEISTSSSTSPGGLFIIISLYITHGVHSVGTSIHLSVDKWHHKSSFHLSKEPAELEFLSPVSPTPPVSSAWPLFFSKSLTKPKLHHEIFKGPDLLLKGLEGLRPKGQASWEDWTIQAQKEKKTWIFKHVQRLSLH